MDANVRHALDDTLEKWQAMSSAVNEEAESAASDFEASFYRFIDALHEWVNGLEQRPQTLEELLDLPLMKEILNLLPAPLYLNVETEAELIVENRQRVDDEKYD